MGALGQMLDTLGTDDNKILSDLAHCDVYAFSDDNSGRARNLQFFAKQKALIKSGKKVQQIMAYNWALKQDVCYLIDVTDTDYPCASKSNLSLIIEKAE